MFVLYLHGLSTMYKADFFLLATSLITSRASPVAAVIAGMFSFIMPAFSAAMDLIAVTRYSVCYGPIFVITLTSGVTTFVASSLPPMPTSKETRSARFCLKYRRASAVVASKKVHFRSFTGS